LLGGPLLLGGHGGQRERGEGRDCQETANLSWKRIVHGCSYPNIDRIQQPECLRFTGSPN